MNTQLQLRLAGVGLIVLAAVVGWMLVYQPLEAARAGAMEVEVQSIATIGVGLLGVFGIGLLALGDRLVTHRNGERALTKLGAFVAIAGLACGGGLYWWLNQQLTLLGYQ